MWNLHCLIVGHDLVLERYGADGRRLKDSLAWRCERCMKIVGTTTLRPNRRLLDSLRSQAKTLGRRLRIVERKAG